MTYDDMQLYISDSSMVFVYIVPYVHVANGAGAWHMSIFLTP